MRAENKQKSWNFFQLFVQYAFTVLEVSDQRVADRSHLFRLVRF